MNGDHRRPSTTLYVVAATGLLTLLYAVVRYHIFGDVAWGRFPSFTLNKALAWSAATLLALAVAAGPWSRYRGRPSPLCARRLGRYGTILAAIHVAMALGLTTPTGLPSWYQDGVLRDGAVWATAFGAIAAATLLQSWRTPANSHRVELAMLRRLRTVTVTMVALHTLAMGGAGWFTPEHWPGGMPPITALAFMTLGVALALRWLSDGTSDAP